MKFIDSIDIKVIAGRGGDGIASFMRGKYMPKMGPDGGDGGKGGSVFARGDRQLNTLSALRFRAFYKAGDGGRGGTKNCRGAFGEDLTIPLPLGTVIYDKDTNEVIGELIEDGQEIMVAKGGRHGLGNVHWATSTHQAPEEFRPGEKGETKTLRLDLKLLADVGLAGFPNAGKSTLLSVVSAARPKIADYPFTTLTPNLGVVEIRGKHDYDVRSLVMADVPGLIEGASEGRGLGLQFLKHLERTSLVAFVLDAADEMRPPLDALTVLKQELSQFSPELAGKPSLVILNKVDLLDDVAIERTKKPLEQLGYEVLVISGATSQGIPELKNRLYQLVQEAKMRAAETPAPAPAESLPKGFDPALIERREEGAPSLFS